MKTDWRAELAACDNFTEKQKGIVKARLLACEEQGGDTDIAFMWIKTVLKVQSDGAEVSGISKVEAGKKKPDTLAQLEEVRMRLADCSASLSSSDRPSETGNVSAGSKYTDAPPSTGAQMPHLPASLFPYAKPANTAAENAEAFTRMQREGLLASLFPSYRPSETGDIDTKTESKKPDTPHCAGMQTQHFPASLFPSDGPSDTGNAKAKAGSTLADFLAQAASGGMPPHHGYPPEVLAPPSMPTSFPASPFPSGRPSETGNADAKTGKTNLEVDALSQAESADMQKARVRAWLSSSGEPSETGKDDAKTGSKYADKLAQELEDARMQRARLVASRSRANRPSDTGGTKDYIVRVLQETGWAWVPRSGARCEPPLSTQSPLNAYKEHSARWGAANPPISPSTAMKNSTWPPSA